jgi:hypothetical protein
MQRLALAISGVLAIAGALGGCSASAQPPHGSGADAPSACSAKALFAAAEAGQHFSADSTGYNATIRPVALEPVCDDGWAVALISHPYVGSTDGGVLFHVVGGRWVYAAEIGGVPAECMLEQRGVPHAVAAVLIPPSQSQPASYCGQ